MKCLTGAFFALTLTIAPLEARAQATAPRAGETPPTPDRGTDVERMELRVKRAKIGLGASAGAIVVGGVFVGVSFPNLGCEEPGTAGAGGNCPAPGWALPLFVTGVTVGSGGVLGMITSGILLGVRKRKLRRLKTPPQPKRRKAHWDTTRARLLF